MWIEFSLTLEFYEELRYIFLEGPWSENPWSSIAERKKNLQIFFTTVSHIPINAFEMLRQTPVST